MSMSHVNWRSKGKDFWLPFGSLGTAERRRFLLEKGLQYRDVPKCKGCEEYKCGSVFFHCSCIKPEIADEALEYGEENNVSNYTPEERRTIRINRAKRKKSFNANFEKKLEHSRRLVKRVLREHRDRKIVLAYSGGIDSECCVQLFKEAVKDGRVQVIFGNTLVNFPEARERVKELEQEFGIEIIQAKPDRGVSFKTIVRDYGLPIYSRSSSDKQKRKATIKCCYLLKKKPMKIVTKDADVLILGLRGEENQNRKLGIYNNGDYFKSKTSQWRVYPIAFWRRRDLWNFQELEGFNYNKIYDHTNCGEKGLYKLKNGRKYIIRTGCWSCPQAVGFGYLEWLKEYYPKFYKALMVNFGVRNHPRYKWLLVKQKKEQLKRKGFKPCGALDEWTK